MPKKRILTDADLIITNEGASVYYQKGDQIDDLTIIRYVGKAKYFKRTAIIPVYIVECTCGNREYKSQDYLRKVRDYIKGCWTCTERRRKEHWYKSIGESGGKRKKATSEAKERKKLLSMKWV